MAMENESEEAMDFSLLKNHPKERRFIILKTLKNSILDMIGIFKK